MTIPVPTLPVYQPNARPSANSTQGAFLDKTWKEFFRIQQALAAQFALTQGAYVSITEFNSGVGDGRDATQAIKDAVAYCAASRRGPIVYPIGDYPYTETIVNPCAIMHVGLVNPAGGAADLPNMSPTLHHEFNGTGFRWTGSTDPTAYNSGGGMTGLRHVQSFGTAASTGGVGAAIQIVPTDLNHRMAWMKFSNLTIEEAGNAPWTWALEADAQGIANGWIDLFIDRVDPHVSSTTGDCGAFRFNGGDNVFMNDCQCSINGTVSIGDTDMTTGAQLSNVNVSNLVLDRVTDMLFDYGIVTNLTTTINTSGRLTVGRLAGTITDASAGACLIDWYDGTAWNTNRPLKLMGGVTTYSGLGVPSVGLGADGDWYQRFDTPGVALQRLYIKAAGAWVGIL